MTMRARVFAYLAQSGMAALQEGTQAVAGSIIETNTHVRPSLQDPPLTHAVMHEPPMHDSVPQSAGTPQGWYSRPRTVPVSGTGPVSGRGPESIGALA
jgi:hypothetical protein